VSFAAAAKVAALVATQALQIVTAFFPAPPIQVFAGHEYGPWWGATLCLIGILLGNIIVFLTMRKARGLIHKRFPQLERKPKIKLLDPSRLNNMKYPELIVVAMNIIPFLPNGLVPYVFARTKIRLWRYLAAVAVGAIPAVMIFTGLGSAIMKANTTLIIVLAAFVVVIAIFVFTFRRRILDSIERLES